MMPSGAWCGANRMSSSLLPRLDAHTFGPWAVLTGASSGIGRAIARHVAASGIGVVVGNAGFASPGELLKIDREELLRAVRIKVDANLVLVHHFGNKLAARN